MIFSYPKLSVYFSLLWMTLPLKTPGEAADEKMTSFAMELAEVRKDLMVEKEPWSRKLTIHFKKCWLLLPFWMFFWSHMYKMEVCKITYYRHGAWNGLKDFESLVRLVASIKQSRNSVSHLLLTLKASFAQVVRGSLDPFTPYIYIFQVIGWLAAYTLPFK